MVKAGGTCGGRETTEAVLQPLLTEMGYKVGVFDGALNQDTISAEVREHLIVR